MTTVDNIQPKRHNVKHRCTSSKFEKKEEKYKRAHLRSALVSTKEIDYKQNKMKKKKVASSH